MAVPKPDYLSRDYTGLRQSMLTYAQQAFPEWHPASEGDMGVMMVELFAYMGDILSYYTDRAQFENYLPTATQRDSILNLAFMLGYTPNSGTPAVGTVALTTDKGTAALTVPEGTQITTNRVEALDGPIVFETTADVDLPANPDGTAVAVSTPVQEGTTETFLYIGESTGMPSQTFLLPHTGVYRETIQIFVEDGAGSTIINDGSSTPLHVSEWVQADKLLAADDHDKMFESRYTSTTTNVLFGDDINGAIPPTGLKVFATYRHGVGAAGNLAAGVVRLINTRGQQLLGPVKVALDPQNSPITSPMSGGADPESDDSIRLNAPRVYRTQERVVTERDFVEVALGTEGVAQANVVVGTFTSVTLFITSADGGPPTDSLKQAVLDRLDGKTLAGVTVTVGDPTFVTVNFGKSDNPINIEVDQGFSLKNVKAAARREIKALVGRLEFGDVLSVSKVYSVLNRIEGVVNVDIPVMARSDDTQTGTARITPREWEVFVTGNSHIFLDVERKKQKKNTTEDSD